MAPEKKHEQEHPFSKKTQYLTLLCTSLLNLGDGVELYLPSVLTQPVGCELQITKLQEDILALALYVSLGLTTLLTIPLSNRFGRRNVLLTAVYLDIAVTVLCAIVPNYVSLLGSRFALGICIAMNFSTLAVYMSEIAAPEFRFWALTFIFIFFTVGGGWCGLLAYFFLERIGWRYFVLLSSIPVFVPPAILLQFVLPESKYLRDGDPETTAILDKENAQGEHSTSKMMENDTDDTPPKLKSAISRIFKICFIITTRGFTYFGAILLVPAMLKEFNLKDPTKTLHCGGIQGSQFLIVTVLFGVCHIVGKFSSVIALNFISHVYTLISYGIILTIFNTLMNFYLDNLTVLLVCIGVVQTAVAANANEVILLANDRSFFKTKYIAVSSGLVSCTWFTLSMISNTVSELCDYPTVIKVHTATSILSNLAGVLFLFKD